MRQPYTQAWTRREPGFFLYLLDQSAAMSEQLASSETSKQDGLATAVNHHLQHLVMMSCRGEAVRHYMDVAVIGYRTDEEANAIIESALCEPLQHRDWVSIVEISENMELETRMQEYYDDDLEETRQAPVEFPVWVKPKAQGGRPMCTALHKAYRVLEEWIGEHPDSFPPVVFHFTGGGECTEPGDPKDYADPLKSLSTNDGNVLLFHCCLSETKAEPILFPSSGESLPGGQAQELFTMSSEIPASMLPWITAHGFEVRPGARGMGFNVDMVSLLKFLGAIGFAEQPPQHQLR